MTDPPPATDPLVDPVLKAAFDATLAEMRALDASETGWNDLDVPLIAERVFTHLPKIQSLRSNLARFGPEYQLQWVDDLERYTNAALYAFHNYRKHPEPAGTLPELARRAARLRNVLVTDCTPYFARNLLDYGKFKQFDGGPSAQSIACDLLVLRTVMDELYPRVKGKCPFSPSDLREAEAFAEAILSRLMDPHEPPPQVWEPADLHFRAFTLLDRAYQEARRGVQYVRWDHEDEHSFTPPLYFYNRLFERWRVWGLPVDRENAERRARFTTAALTAVARKKPMRN